MPPSLPVFALPCSSSCALALASCGGGGEVAVASPSFPCLPAATIRRPAADAKYTVGGSVSGLLGSGLVLHTGRLGRRGRGRRRRFVFSEKLDKGASYAVSVKQQPSNPSQTCTVNNASGTIGDADVGNVAVVCATTSQKVSVAVTGLDAAGGLVLQNNAGDDLAVNADGTFSFDAGGGRRRLRRDGKDTTHRAPGVHREAGLRHDDHGARCRADDRLHDAGADRFAFTADEGTSSVSMYIVGSDGSLSSVGRFRGRDAAACDHAPFEAVHLRQQHLGRHQGRLSSTPSTPPRFPRARWHSSAPSLPVSERPRISSVSRLNGQHAYGSGTMLHRLDRRCQHRRPHRRHGRRRWHQPQDRPDPQGRFAFVVVNSTFLAAFRLDPATGEPISARVGRCPPTADPPILPSSLRAASPMPTSATPLHVARLLDRRDHWRADPDRLGPRWRHALWHGSRSERPLPGTRRTETPTTSRRTASTHEPARSRRCRAAFRGGQRTQLRDRGPHGPLRLYGQPGQQHDHPLHDRQDDRLARYRGQPPVHGRRAAIPRAHRQMAPAACTGKGSRLTVGPSRRLPLPCSLRRLVGSGL